MGTIETRETEETIENNQNEAETTPFEQHCPRHGTRIRRYFGCPKCVIEEVRRHERRMDASYLLEDPIPVDSVDQATAPLAEMR